MGSKFKRFNNIYYIFMGELLAIFCKIKLIIHLIDESYFIFFNFSTYQNFT